MIYFCGIDPGKSGAWAILNEEGALYDNGAGDCFKCLNHKDITPTLTVLEQVHAFPGQGVSSVFSFGANYGGWVATLEILEIPYQLVPPQKWQKAILGSFPKGESKLRALEFAQRRWPTLNLKKKDHGIVDALCIALYAMRLHKGESHAPDIEREKDS